MQEASCRWSRALVGHRRGTASTSAAPVAALLGRESLPDATDTAVTPAGPVLSDKPDRHLRLQRQDRSWDYVVSGDSTTHTGTSTVGDTDCDHPTSWNTLLTVTARAGPTIVDVAVAEPPGATSTPSGPNANNEPNTLTDTSPGFDNVHVTVVTPLAESHTATPDASTHGPADTDDDVVVPAATHTGTSTVGDTDCDHPTSWNTLLTVTARAGPTIVDVAVAEPPGATSTPSGPNANNEPNTLTDTSPGFDNVHVTVVTPLAESHTATPDASTHGPADTDDDVVVPAATHTGTSTVGDTDCDHPTSWNTLLTVTARAGPTIVDVAVAEPPGATSTPSGPNANNEPNTLTDTSPGFDNVHVTVVTPLAESHTATPDASTHGPADTDDDVVVPAATHTGTSTVGDTDCDHPTSWNTLLTVTARAGPTIVDVAVAEAPGATSTPSGPNANNEPNTLTDTSPGFDNVHVTVVTPLAESHTATPDASTHGAAGTHSSADGLVGPPASLRRLGLRHPSSRPRPVRYRDRRRPRSPPRSETSRSRSRAHR